MRVGIDISNAVVPLPTGVARYVRHLSAALLALPDPPELSYFCRASRRRFGDPRRHFPGGRLCWLSDWRAPSRIDVFHATDLRIPRRLKTPLVTTIHDLSAYHRTDHASESFVRKKRRGYEEAARRAATIVTHTKAVGSDVIDHLGVDPDRIHAVHLADPLAGVAVQAAAPRPLLHDDSQILVVGGPSVRKGSHRIEALLNLWAAELNWRPRVSWVGCASAEQRQEFEQSLTPDVRAQIQLLGHVPDPALAELYTEAAGMLFLSDTEGFGLPLLEAARRHCPILAIESASVQEVIGDGAFWFREPIAQSLPEFRRFLDTTARDDVAATAARRAEDFCWSKTARQTLDAYEAACKLQPHTTPRRNP